MTPCSPRRHTTLTTTCLMELETHSRVSVPLCEPFTPIGPRAIRRLRDDGDFVTVGGNAVHQSADLMLRMRAIERWHFNDSVFTFSETFKRLEHSRIMEQQSHDNKQLLAQAPGNVQRSAGGDPCDSPLGLRGFRTHHIWGRLRCRSGLVRNPCLSKCTGSRRGRHVTGTGNSCGRLLRGRHCRFGFTELFDCKSKLVLLWIFVVLTTVRHHVS